MVSTANLHLYIAGDKRTRGGGVIDDDDDDDDDDDELLVTAEVPAPKATTSSSAVAVASTSVWITGGCAVERERATKRFADRNFFYQNFGVFAPAVVHCSNPF